MEKILIRKEVFDGVKSIENTISEQTSMKERRMMTYIGRDQREIRFRNASDEIIRSNRRLRDRIQLVKPFYLGADAASVPNDEDRLEAVLNPKRNNACHCLANFCAAAKEYRPGEYPELVLDSLRKSTLDLIHNSIEPILRTPVCNKLVTIVSDLHNYLRTPDLNLTPEQHIANLDKFRTLWSQTCCRNSDAFYDETTRRLQARNPTPRKTCSANSRRGTGCRGPQTKMMRKQLEDFKLFLQTHPISEIGQGKTVGARANQFWTAHQKTYERAAKAPGEKRGYPGPKGVASAYRTSKH